MGRLGKVGREVVKRLDNQAETFLIITINDTSLGYLPLIIIISDTCKNQPKRLDFDNTINLSSLIVILESYTNYIEGPRSLEEDSFMSCLSLSSCGNLDRPMKRWGASLVF
jgi:hypothetical protein